MQKEKQKRKSKDDDRDEEEEKERLNQYIDGVSYSGATLAVISSILQSNHSHSGFSFHIPSLFGERILREFHVANLCMCVYVCCQYAESIYKPGSKYSSLVEEKREKQIKYFSTFAI